MILLGLDFTAMDTVKHKDNKFKLQYSYWEYILLLWPEHKETGFIMLVFLPAAGLDVMTPGLVWGGSEVASITVM